VPKPSVATFFFLFGKEREKVYRFMVSSVEGNKRTFGFGSGQWGGEFIHF
jgi:hypothetical protein